MKKYVILIICSIFLIGVISSNNIKANSPFAIVERKITKNTALVGYPTFKTDYGTTEYKKLFYVKDEILRNYADDDEITGYKVEKIFNKTHVFRYPSGLTKTLSCGKLVKK